MSDLFISYAREDRALAQSLAQDFESRGYSVWWDAELVGSDDFQDVILAALARARAAVVIWSKSSVKSAFVRDEARYALHYKKLVAVKSSDLDILDLPFGFQGQHTGDLHDREQIVRAVTKLGVAPVANSAAAADSWGSVKGTRNVDTLLSWLERNPTHNQRQAAVQRLRFLMESGDGTIAKDQNARIKRTSNFVAFLSGLAFRVPSFQLSAQGKWSSIGVSIGLLVVLLVGMRLVAGLIIGIFGKLLAAGWKETDSDKVIIPIFFLALCVLSWIAKSRFTSCVRERNFAAAWTMAPIFVFLVAMTIGISAGIVGILLTGRPSNHLPESFLPIIVGAFGAGALLAVVYMIWKVRAAR
jgi:hypothetical protein